MVPASLRNITDLLIGFTLAFQYIAVKRRGFFQQKDVKTTGAIFSTILTLLLNIIWLVIIQCVVTNNYGAIVTYFRENSVIRALDIYEAIPQWWQHRRSNWGVWRE